MMSKLRSRSKPKGQTIIMVTLALIPMFGLLGLVVDIGWMQYLRKSAQKAVDAAAMAAIIEFNDTISGSTFTCGVNGVVCQPTAAACPAGLTTASDPIQTACLYAQQNGFSVSNSRQTVTVQADVTHSPPTAPGVHSAAYWVTVRATQSVPQLFSAVLGNSMGGIAARATAALSPAQDCIYVLNKTAPAAFQLSGSPTVTAYCGIYDDSNASNALYINSNSANLSATSYDIVGGVYSPHGLTPPPNLGAPVAPDPLAHLPVPTFPANHCDSTNYVLPNWGNVTIQPGVYCGGIQVGNGSLTLAAGMYIIMGGGISTQSANSSIGGDGVTIYNTYNATYPYGPININATSTVSFSAPNTGTYAGILFFADRSATPTVVDSFGGGSTARYQGTIYEPNSTITFAGNANLNAAYTIIVVNQLQLVGNTVIQSDYSGLTNGTPIKRLSLVE